MSAPRLRRWRAAALVLALSATGAFRATAAEPAPAPPRLRIVPALRFGTAEPAPDPGSLAPRRRSPLAWYQDECSPGAVAVVYCPQPRESFSTALLGAGSRVVSRGACFPWGAGWLSLIGVPATAPPGSYELWLPDVRVPFRVTARMFASEAIRLSGALAALRTRSDARTTAEAAELAQLLAAADRDAVYEIGAFSLPLAQPRRTAGYGDRRQYQYDGGGSDSAVHAGLDLALPEGSPVAACGRGRVVMAKERVVTGWTVVIEHLPGLYSLYFHLREVIVGNGELVERGQRIGSVGMTGLATGPHLHWEVRVGGVAVDPDRLTAGMPFTPGCWPIPPVPPGGPTTPPVGPTPGTAAGPPVPAEPPRTDGRTDSSAPR
jgi:murein DD-endopeptidase MepM/ murein hydrolase activator NlpD